MEYFDSMLPLCWALAVLLPVSLLLCVTGTCLRSPSQEASRQAPAVGRVEREGAGGEATLCSSGSTQCLWAPEVTAATASAAVCTRQAALLRWTRAGCDGISTAGRDSGLSPASDPRHHPLLPSSYNPSNTVTSTLPSTPSV